MIMKKTLSTVHWKKYLDINNGNPQVKKFLESRGDDVLWQISQNVNKVGGIRRELSDTLVMVIHENAPNAILIEREEYQEVLDLCLSWFEARELYEKCSEILKYKKNIENINSNQSKKESTKQIPKLI